MKLKIWQKNLLSAIVIMAVGFILFNAAFLLAALVLNGFMILLGSNQNTAPPFVGRAAYFILILLISWLVFRSKLNDLIKASFLTMPLMVVLVMGGIGLYTQPKWIVAGAGALVIGAVILYLYKKRLPWLYYFATIFVAATALCVMLFNVEI